MLLIGTESHAYESNFFPIFNKSLGTEYMKEMSDGVVEGEGQAGV